MKPAAITMAGVALVAIASCDLFTAPQAQPREASLTELRAELGAYHVDVIPFGTNLRLGQPSEDGTVLLAPVPRGSAVTQLWKAGVLSSLTVSTGAFSGSSRNNLGDVAGTLDSVPAVWYVGDAAPTVLMPAQPAVAAKMSVNGITDRREILLATVFYSQRPGVWKTGEFRELPSGDCRGTSINNRGVLLAESCNLLYDTWHLSSSPFGASPATSSRLSGSKCEYAGNHGRVSYGLTLNDSNEVIDSDAAWITPAGCRKMPYVLVALNDRGLVLGYAQPAVCSPTACDVEGYVITDHGSAPLDSLLAPDASDYRVVGLSGINNSGQISGFARRKSDGTKLAVLMSPKR